MVSLLITNDFPPVVSGISTVFYQLIRNLPGEKPVILAPRVKGCEEWDKKESFSVIRKMMPLGESKKAKLLKTLLNTFWAFYYVRKLGVTRLHCGQVLSSGLAGLFCKRVFGLPYSVWVWGSETIRFRKARVLLHLIDRITQEADVVVSDSSFTTEEYLRFGTPPEKLLKLTPGVDTKRFSPAPPNYDLLRKFDLSEKKVLLTVARLDERKGHDRVIEALPSLLKEIPEIRYLIVGKGREELRLRALAEQLRVQKEVTFAGYVPDEELPNYYNLCDLFVLPNRETANTQMLEGDYEGFGIVFLEAAACGKPVIAGKSGGTSDAVVDGVTGLFVNPHSPEALAQAIKMLLNDVEKAREFGLNGRVRVEREFEWGGLAQLLKKIL
ncbi:MAG: glycosyltransferase family 4 protein [Candidatus Tectomicrobia bacterium]|nr:glycosyltransferase family 4 protein [Candidatus Tectomicrobia bacterium]